MKEIKGKVTCVGTQVSKEHSMTYIEINGRQIDIGEIISINVK